MPTTARQMVYSVFLGTGLFAVGTAVLNGIKAPGDYDDSVIFCFYAGAAVGIAVVEMALWLLRRSTSHR